MITDREKVNLLEDRLRCLALLEYGNLKGLDKQIAGSKEKYIDKYIHKFIGKVMNNSEIVEILNEYAKKNVPEL